MFCFCFITYFNFYIYYKHRQVYEIGKKETNRTRVCIFIYIFLYFFISVMDFNEQVLERDAQRYVVLVLNFFITFLQTLIPLVVKFSSSYPRLFLYLTIAVMLYITWSFLTNLAKLIKRLFYLYIILFVITIHLRGWEQFFIYDLPLVYNQCKDGLYLFSQSDEYNLLKSHAQYLSKQIYNRLFQ